MKKARLTPTIKTDQNAERNDDKVLGLTGRMTGRAGSRTMTMLLSGCPTSAISRWMVRFSSSLLRLSSSISRFQAKIGLVSEPSLSSLPICLQSLRQPPCSHGLSPPLFQSGDDAGDLVVIIVLRLLPSCFTAVINSGCTLAGNRSGPRPFVPGHLAGGWKVRSIPGPIDGRRRWSAPLPIHWWESWRFRPEYCCIRGNRSGAIVSSC